MNDVIEKDEAGGRADCDREIEIKVNDQKVVFADHKQTGLSIKETAIAQGAGIQLDFVLSIERGNGKTDIVGDDEKVTITKNSCFLAIPDDDNSRSLSGNVEAAIDRVRQNFPEATLEVIEDDKGGAFVIVDSVPLGSPYAQSESWIGFQITAACEYADCYPHFLRPDLSRLDGAPLGGGFSSTTFQVLGSPRIATQVSRRTNKVVVPSIDNPALKLLKVIRWLKAR